MPILCIPPRENSLAWPRATFRLRLLLDFADGA